MKIKIDLSSLILGLLYLIAAFVLLRYYLPTLFDLYPEAIPVMKEVLRGDGKSLLAFYLIIGVLVGLGSSNLGNVICGLITFKKKEKTNELSL